MKLIMTSKQKREVFIETLKKLQEIQCKLIGTCLEMNIHVSSHDYAIDCENLYATIDAKEEYYCTSYLMEALIKDNKLHVVNEVKKFIKKYGIEV